MLYAKWRPFCLGLNVLTCCGLVILDSGNDLTFVRRQEQIIAYWQLEPKKQIEMEFE